jgi:hypothetical protein
MRFEVRLKISGSNFNPQEFVENHALEGAGEVRPYLGHRAVPGGLGDSYWVSKPVKVLESPEVACINLLTSLKAQLKAARACGGKISIQISAYYEEDDDRRGFYVPSELIHLIGEVDADLDYSPEIDLQALSHD